MINNILTLRIIKMPETTTCAFFLFGGMGAFQEELNPLSGRAMLEVCIVPSLLYGSENWIQPEDNLVALEHFQGKLQDESSNCPNSSHSAITVCVDLQWPFVQARFLMIK